MRFPFTKQHDTADCGPACLRMITNYYGKEISLEKLRQICLVGKDGVSLSNLADAAKEIGFDTLTLQLNMSESGRDLPLPAILYWKNNHFVVLAGIKYARNGAVQSYRIADPAVGIITVDPHTFHTNWHVFTDKMIGYALALEPNNDFSTVNHETFSSTRFQKLKTNIRFIKVYLGKFRRYYYQLICGMIASSILSLAFPFLTQNIVDGGIANKNLNFIVLILLFQLGIILSSTLIEFLRRQLSLHISARMNISIIADFLSKLMRLEISFFDSKNIGDITNRINDQRRIESFISGSVLNTFFVFLNFIVLSIVLGIYSFKIFGLFIAGSALSLGWVMLFLSRRKNMDYRLFNASSANNETIYEIVHGMQEIKLNSFEAYKKAEWQKNQVSLFGLTLKNLKLEQYQGIGSVFITQLKNILITFIAARAVITGDLSLGMMLSISMIIGQLNAPIEEFINFLKAYQFADISLERMNEVYEKPDEEDLHLVGALPVSANGQNGHEPGKANGYEGIYLNNLSFSYSGAKSPKVLDGLNIGIPKGKITALVGNSGSGKTTFLKLLLKFYPPAGGAIYTDGTDLRRISAKKWRSQCGIVMQEGYLFNDSIARNIATGDEQIDMDKLINAARIACIYEFITGLPQSFETKIGRSGIGLSTGQKQRIMIARAVYRDPAYIFLDEATSSLDANNEAQIIENMDVVFKGKTVVIIAHRLSTVKNADQILVLDKGKIVESGNHLSLIEKKGYYFTLIKNQLELDSVSA